MVKQNNYYPLTKQEQERVDLLVSVITETLNTGDLFAQNKLQEAVTGRAIFCWLLNKYTFFGQMPFQKIATIIHRDYQTVKRMIENHEDCYYTDSRYCNDYHSVGAAYSRALQRLERLNEVERKMNEIEALLPNENDK
jgi:hypothetical protein